MKEMKVFSNLIGSIISFIAMIFLTRNNQQRKMYENNKKKKLFVVK